MYTNPISLEENNTRGSYTKGSHVVSLRLRQRRSRSVVLDEWNKGTSQVDAIIGFCNIRHFMEATEATRPCWWGPVGKVGKLLNFTG